MTHIFSVIVPNWLKALDKILSNNATQNFFVGDKLTIADFAVGAFANSFFYNDANPHAEKMKLLPEGHENFKKWAASFNGIMADYLAGRPKPRPF
mmetsp:Transcript_43236/g.41592  ORF Transcript_43236/g.41592 Transcript_43236/m.41592 type:complete len:95 (+) Transcript_43236:252-536(+)